MYNYVLLMLISLVCENHLNSERKESVTKQVHTTVEISNSFLRYME